jgi:branched-chain amino acid transport system ATP-binding protein
VALELANRAYLLQHGEVVLDASAAELREDPRLRASYLGAKRETPEPAS